MFNSTKACGASDYALMLGGRGQSRAAAGKIYWTDDDAIRRANLNGMGVEIVVVG